MPTVRTRAPGNGFKRRAKCRDVPPVRALFPLDGSEATYRAVEGGLKRLADVKDAQATFLVVLDAKIQSMPQDAREYLEFDDEDEIFVRPDEAKAVLDKAAAIAKKLKFTKTTGKTVTGEVFKTVLAEAKAHDLLVMHRLDRDEVDEKRRGGVLERICRNAPCDVWLVNTP